MENQKQNEQDFWLLQYQKLLDSQPTELSNKSASIDPVLGYCFLVNGVVHCLPFLSKIWQNKQTDLYDITDADLRAAGVKKDTDRMGILKSIKEYLYNDRAEGCSPCSDNGKLSTPDEATTPIPAAPSTDNNIVDNLGHAEIIAECVICMEESVSFF